MNELVYAALIGVHAAAGAVGVVAGVIATITKLAGRWHPTHVLSGRAFHGAMCVVGATALPMAARLGSVFFLMIGVFSAYLSYVGFRLARMGRVPPHTGDWTAAAIMATTGFAMLGWGSVTLVEGSNSGLILLVFGGIGSMLVVTQVRGLRSAPKGRERIGAHLVFMLAALTAAITAFGVVNLSGFGSPLLVWLGPSLVSTPLIMWLRDRVART